MIGTIILYVLLLLLVLVVIILLYIKYVVLGIPVYCRSNASMKGKTVIITGANSGIGKETAIDLAKRGARVICACRNKQRGETSVEEMKAASGCEDIILEQLDTSDYDSVKSFAELINQRESRLDVLINNAGIGHHVEKNKQGHDLVFATNHLGHFLLTHLLLDLLNKSAPARIVNVSSVAHEWGRTGKTGLCFKKVDGRYRYLRLYDASKLAQILHVTELTRRLKGTGVTADALHPGAVATNIWQSLDYGFMKPVAELLRLCITYAFWTSEQGAQTTVYVAVDESLQEVSGKYFKNCAVEVPSKFARSEEQAKQLWDVSMEMLDIKE